jgi:hypothetical protein
MRIRRFVISGLSDYTKQNKQKDGNNFKEKKKKNVIVGKMCQADMTKLIVAFPSFANRPKTERILAVSETWYFHSSTRRNYISLYLIIYCN